MRTPCEHRLQKVNSRRSLSWQFLQWFHLYVIYFIKSMLDQAKVLRVPDGFTSNTHLWLILLFMARDWQIQYRYQIIAEAQ